MHKKIIYKSIVCNCALCFTFFNTIKGQNIYQELAMNKQFIKILNIKSITISQNEYTYHSKYNKKGQIVLNSCYTKKENITEHNKETYKYHINGKLAIKNQRHKIYLNKEGINRFYENEYRYDSMGNEIFFNKNTYTDDKHKERYFSRDVYIYDNKGRTTIHVVYKRDYREDSIVTVYNDINFSEDIYHYTADNELLKHFLIKKDTLGRIILKNYSYQGNLHHSHQEYAYNSYNQLNYELDKTCVDGYPCIELITRITYKDSLPIKKSTQYLEVSKTGDSISYFNIEFVKEYNMQNKLTKTIYYDKKNKTNKIEQITYNNDGQILNGRHYNSENQIILETQYKYTTNKSLLEIKNKSENEVRIRTFYSDGSLKSTKVFSINNCTYLEKSEYIRFKKCNVIDFVNSVLDIELRHYTPVDLYKKSQIIQRKKNGVTYLQKYIYNKEGAIIDFKSYKNKILINRKKNIYTYNKKLIKQIIKYENGKKTTLNIRINYF